ncbi:MAG: ABC transporter ATP-binding protein [Thermoplasmata archaeon]|nr:ABC transporter ATP-binding protein [Thermoplasmata archaeon]
MVSSSSSRAPNGLPLRVEALTVRYGAQVAVDQLTFEVRPGEIYGLLGSNGAGKSSTIKAIVGLVPPASGTISVFGMDPIKTPIAVKERIGYVPESTLLFDALTPREFLEYIASVRHLTEAEASERARSYATAFQIESDFERPIATLSNGTRQKVLIAAAFLHQPPLLVLDEPLNNLDPRAVRIMKELLTSYVRHGQRGVLFSTHTLEVAQQLCQRVAILDHGLLRGEGTLEELRQGVQQGDASLEEIFLRLTREEEAVRVAVRSLGG